MMEYCVNALKFKKKIVLRVHIRLPMTLKMFMILSIYMYNYKPKVCGIFCLFFTVSSALFNVDVHGIFLFASRLFIKKELNVFVLWNLFTLRGLFFIFNFLSIFCLWVIRMHHEQLSVHMLWVWRMFALRSLCVQFMCPLWALATCSQHTCYARDE